MTRQSLAVLLAGTAITLCAPAQAAEVTYQRLLNASSEPQNWLMRMGNYSNWNYSTLKTINRSNVGQLKVKFMASLGDPNRPNKATEYFTPLVEDGFMYVGNQWQTYWKYDVRNEKPTVVWKFDAKAQGGGRSGHSVALLGNNVYFNTNADTNSPRLVALDKDSGQVVFDVNTTAADVLPNQGHSAAPLAIKNMIVIGQANRNENGRGYLAAYTADTGKLIWRFLTVPNPGDPGSETWADKRTIPTGGGAIWTEPSYDPQTNLIYVGTANPVHMFDPQGRPGDNLYTNSIIAIDADTGKLKWYFQTVPNESWDYDAVAITQLYDTTIGGEMRKVLGQTNRNGFFYTLDRTNGQFILGKPFTTVNWTVGLDAKTGAPARLRRDQDGAGLCRPRGALRQEGDRRAPGALRHADADAEHLRSDARPRLFQRHDRRSQLLQLAPRRSGKGTRRHRLPRNLLRRSHQGQRRRADRAQRAQSQLQGEPRPARRHRRAHRRNGEEARSPITRPIPACSAPPAISCSWATSWARSRPTIRTA